MKAEYLNPFFIATKDVFKLMLDLDVKKGNVEVVSEMVPSKEANVILGVTGDLQGSVIFSFPKKMALDMVKIMSGMEFKEIDNFVSSALGEVANIIGGNAMTNLVAKNYKCNIAPPQVIIGKHKSLSIASKQAIKLSMITSIGEFDVIIFLAEKQD
ncbi:MAG TPA: chemotaxis protein CheX [Thermotoga sp.]|nr:chemotaxis protein CheX [Thermotoga sp.]